MSGDADARDSTAPLARRFDPASKLAAGVLAILLLASLLARSLRVAGNPEELVGPRLSPPSAQWPLGTDSLGRSLLPRLLEGISTTLLLSAAAVLCTAAVSTALGIVAGYHGGMLSDLVMRCADILYAFPAIVLAIGVAAVIGPGQTAAIASIILVTVPLMTRMVGAAARSVSARDFVAAARISGVATHRILIRHILTNVWGTVAIQGTYAMSIGILVEGVLSFLGHGVQLPSASLGLLIQEGSLYMVNAPWLIVSPGLVLICAILAVNLIGDGLRDHVDPRETRSLV